MRLIRAEGKTQFVQMRLHQPGQIVYMEQNKLYYARSGLALVKEIHRNGRELLFDILQPDYVTEGGNSRHISYELHVQQTSEIRVIDAEYAEAAGDDLLDKVREFAKRTQFIASIVRCRSMTDRLKLMLVFLSQHYRLSSREESEHGEWITLLPFTHEEMAACINSTRSTVTKLLKQMEAAGLIRYKPFKFAKLIQLSSRIFNENREMQ